MSANGHALPAGGWWASGLLFENCNCTVICPGHTHFSQNCTHERCQGFWALRVDEGSWGGLDLAGARAVVAYDSPRRMIDGGWTEALVLDAASTPAQREAMERILTGAAGGPWEVLARFVALRLPTRVEPILVEDGEALKRVAVAGLLEGAVEPIRGRDRSRPVTIVNMFNQIHAAEQVVARGSSRYADGLLSFAHEGTHGLWSRFTWRVEAPGEAPGRALSHPGTPEGFWPLAWGWWAMTAGMMLPTTWPWLRALHRLAATAQTPAGSAALPLAVLPSFAAGYLLVWSAFGIGAAGLEGTLLGTGPWPGDGPALRSGLLAAAGLYQLTPLKGACLRRCRSPLAALLARWPLQAWGAVRLGAGHGLVCLGCCWGLMLLGLGAGAAHWTWMIALGALVAAEKLTPAGPRVGRWAGFTLLALALLEVART